MSGELAIRRARAEDAAAVHDLQRRAFLCEARLYADDSLPPLTEPEAVTARAVAEECVLLARLDGRPAGTVRGVARDGTCYVGRLAVDPELFRRGIGEALMRELESRFPEAGRFEIFTGHKSAAPLRLYGKLGYAVFREKPIHDGLTIVFMEKWRKG